MTTTTTTDPDTVDEHLRPDQVVVEGGDIAAMSSHPHWDRRLSTQTSPSIESTDNDDIGEQQQQQEDEEHHDAAEKARLANQCLDPPLVAATLIPDATPTIIQHPTLIEAVDATAAFAVAEATSTRVEAAQNGHGGDGVVTELPRSSSHAVHHEQQQQLHPDVEIATIEVDGGMIMSEEEARNSLRDMSIYVSRDYSRATESTDSSDEDDSDEETGNTERRRSKRRTRKAIEKKSRCLKAAVLVISMLMCVAVGAVLATQYANRKHHSDSSNPISTDDQPWLPPEFVVMAPSAAPSTEALDEGCITEAVPTWNLTLPKSAGRFGMTETREVVVTLSYDESQLMAFRADQPSKEGSLFVPLNNEALSVRDFALSKDGTTVVIGVDSYLQKNAESVGGALLVYRWDAKSLEWDMKASLETGLGVVYEVDVSTDGRTIAFCSSRERQIGNIVDVSKPSFCWVYGLSSEDFLIEKSGGFLENLMDPHSSVEVSDDGTRIFLAMSRAAKVKAFDWKEDSQSWEQVGSTMSLGSEGPYQMVSSADGMVLAVACLGLRYDAGEATLFEFINQAWRQIGFASLQGGGEEDEEVRVSLTPDASALLLTTLSRSRRSSHFVHESILFRRTSCDVVFSHPLQIPLPDATGQLAVPPILHDAQLMDNAGDQLVVSTFQQLIGYDFRCKRRILNGLLND